MQLNLTTDYALRCLFALAKMGDNVSSDDIHKEIGVEREFTQKILRRLRDAELVVSTRGKSGGYSLAKPLSEIALLDVMAVTEDTMRINRCLEPDGFCSMKGVENGCAVHGFYLALQNKLDTVLSQTSIQDVIDKTYQL